MVFVKLALSMFLYTCIGLYICAVGSNGLEESDYLPICHFRGYTDLTENRSRGICTRQNLDIISLPDIPFYATNNVTQDLPHSFVDEEIINAGLYTDHQNEGSLMFKDEWLHFHGSIENGRHIHTNAKSDGGRCCETIRETKRETCLKDIFDITREISKFNGRTPLISQVVTCRNVGCKGRCKPVTITIPLLARKSDSSCRGHSHADVELAYFPIPAYCSCRNTHS